MNKTEIVKLSAVDTVMNSCSRTNVKENVPPNIRTGLGAIISGAQWDYSIPAFSIMLENHGCHGYTYKVWAPGTPVNAPFVPVKHEYIRAAFGRTPKYFRFKNLN